MNWDEWEGGEEAVGGGAGWVVITKFWSIVLDDHWSKNIYRQRWLFDGRCYIHLRWSYFTNLSQTVHNGQKHLHSKTAVNKEINQDFIGVLQQWLSFPPITLSLKFWISHTVLRERIKKLKWKFKMAFAMKGGQGGLACHWRILQKTFRIIPWLSNVFCT